MWSNLIWWGICAKYLAFGTYPTSTVGKGGGRVGRGGAVAPHDLPKKNPT